MSGLRTKKELIKFRNYSPLITRMARILSDGYIVGQSASVLSVVSNYEI